MGHLLALTVEDAPQAAATSPTWFATSDDRWDSMQRADFAIDAYLAEPRIARIATNGPAVFPVWFLWEEGAFWWLIGPWSRLTERIAVDPTVALVVDSCDLATGQVRQVRARGTATLLAYDADRAYRKLSRYLGDDPGCWDASRFRLEDPGATDLRFVRLAPARLAAIDLSYAAAGTGGQGP
jgi:nitroimidazol reductase NimA-like FMN-containing flavoprotein (pyridoxamine 5'-phosphate oxidase superfamily)